DILEGLFETTRKHVLDFATDVSRVVRDFHQFFRDIGKVEQHFSRARGKGDQTAIELIRLLKDLQEKKDHLIDHGPLRGKLLQLFGDAFQDGDSQKSLTDQILKDWKQSQGPDLFLTTASLTSSRLVAFALAGADSIGALM